MNKISEKDKLQNIKLEYKILSIEYDKIENDRKFLDLQYKKLFDINSKLWIIEDEIRKLEIKNNFNQEFIELARSVYFTNDERFEIKNLINQHFGSEISEQKQYENYK
tara:strand:+ start:254 stop:577 length:324 start_codon:yes stop_codon:yes gene_type:complete